MKTYTGKRWHNRYPETRDSITVTVLDDTNNQKTLLRSYFPIKASFDMPFDWGKGQVGFGGTNLSASILADHFGSWNTGELEAIPQAIIIAFLYGVLVKLPPETWEIDGDEIQDFIEEYAEAQIEAVERFETAMEEADYYVSPDEADVLYPMTLSPYIPEPDEYRGADSG